MCAEKLAQRICAEKLAQRVCAEKLAERAFYENFAKELARKTGSVCFAQSHWRRELSQRKLAYGTLSENRSVRNARAEDPVNCTFEPPAFLLTYSSAGAVRCWAGQSGRSHGSR